MKPLAIDLYAGLGGWTEGLLAEGYDVIGFDIERHDYGDGKRYPSQLVLQDVLTLHGRQFKDAAIIVASPPCQEYSYMAMPWSRAKAIAEEYRSGQRDVRKLTALFDACFRIQREAIEAAGHFIPLVVENVRGACPWVGRSRWNFGSFHLWGDVPALMPMTKARHLKVGDGNSHRRGEGTSPHFTNRAEHHKNNGGSWFNIGSPGQKEVNSGGDCFNDPSWPGKQGGVKQSGISGPRANGKGDRWFQDGAAREGSKSPARKAASAAIAKIPLPLAQHIARTWKPTRAEG